MSSLAAVVASASDLDYELRRGLHCAIDRAKREREQERAELAREHNAEYLLRYRRPVVGGSYRKLGLAIRQARGDAKLTRKAVAAAIGRHETTYAAYEQGRLNPEPALDLIAQVLDKPREWFFQDPFVSATSRR